MADHATPNLPSSDFEATARFFGPLGFETGYRDDGWMILDRGTAKLEFFPIPDLDPLSSSFSCCLRLDDLDEFYAACRAADLPETRVGHPRLHPPKVEHSGMRIAYMTDPDGTLLRLVQNKTDLGEKHARCRVFIARDLTRDRCRPVICPARRDPHRRRPCRRHAGRHAGVADPLLDDQ